MSAWFACSVVFELSAIMCSILFVAYLVKQDVWTSLAFAISATAFQMASHYSHRWRPTTDAALDAGSRFFASLTAISWVTLEDTQEAPNKAYYVALLFIVSAMLSLVLCTFRRRVRYVAAATVRETIMRADSAFASLVGKQVTL